MGGKAALHLAVSSANSAAVKVLLQAGSNIDIQDYDGNSPLHCAFYHRLSLVKTLVDHGANVGLKNKEGETPLHLAVITKSIEAMKLILKKGADINVQSFSGETPLHVAGRGFEGVYKLCSFLLNNGAKANLQDIHGMTPLHLAVMFDGKYFNEILATESGKSAINIPNNQGIYPLHLATVRRNLQTVKLLLDNGAVVDSKNDNNVTALHLVTATKEISEPIFSLLINKGASPNVQDVDGITPLHNAVENLDMEIVQLLLENGAEVNSKNKKGETPLHIVTCKKSQSCLYIICKTLLANGATTNVQDNSGMTPLHNAVKYQNDKIMQLLLKNGAELNPKNKKGETPLRYVQSVDALELLIQKGAKVNEKDNYGRTVLHNICKDFKKFVTNNENVPCQFSFGGLYATGVVLKLLEWGASQFIKDDLGKIPADYYLFTNVQKKYDIKRTCLYDNNMTRNVQDSPKYQNLEDNCFEEIGRMKLEFFGNNCLHNIFCHTGKPTFLSNKELESAIHSEDLKVKYPVYWCLLRSTYHRSRERGQLFDPALVVLQTGCDLPPEIVHYIVTFVDNDSLRNVIKAKEEFPFEEQLDSTSETESDTESDWIPEFSSNSDSE